jgi:hypothetical protein
MISVDIDQKDKQFSELAPTLGLSSNFNKRNTMIGGPAQSN